MKIASQPAQPVESANGNSSTEINRVFPHKVCINLDRRPDRWVEMQKKFERHGIRDVRRFSALDGRQQAVPPEWTSTNGAYGCLLSHLNVVDEARRLGAPSVLIFEDDVVFDARFQENFRVYFDQLPRDWDMLHFGALHLDDPIEISRNVHQIQRAYSTYAYALNHTVFDEFLELSGKATGPVDVSNLALQTKHACYCFAPHLAWVESDYSDAQEREKNHWYLKESVVVHGSAMDRLLRETCMIIAHQNEQRSESATRSLLFLAGFYAQRLRGINVIIVEQDEEPTISSASLPDGCQHVLLRAKGPLNRGRCFNRGMSIAPPDCKLIIFSDNDIFIEEWDICGNLKMCDRYDCTTGFGSIIELNSSDSLRLQSDKDLHMRWFDPSGYTKHENGSTFSQYSVFNRQIIEAGRGWQEELGQSKTLALRQNQPLRVFAPPNFALRLNH